MLDCRQLAHHFAVSIQVTYARSLYPNGDDYHFLPGELRGKTRWDIRITKREPQTIPEFPERHEPSCPLRHVPIHGIYPRMAC